MSEGIGPLNLADADVKGFDAVEAGRYNAEVFEMKMDAVKNASGTGKMPAGTPMIKIQYKLLTNMEGESQGIENRRVFQTLVIPPNDYDQAKAATMKGMLARVFIALGDDEKDVLSASFNPDFEDYVGRPCVVVLGREPKKTSTGDIVPDEYNNPVKGVKPAGESSSAGGALL